MEFSLVFGILLCMSGVVFSKALTARYMTGKWPHESDDSKAIYDSL